MLLDTDIIIYSVQSQYPELRELIAEHAPLISTISYIEALGFARIQPDEQNAWSIFSVLRRFSCR